MNKLLINSLKFNKVGQAAATGDFANLEVLLNSLEQAPSTTTTDATDSGEEKVSYEGDGPAPKLTSLNLKDLGALSSWLVQNKMTIGGQRVAYAEGEENNISNKENYQPYKLENNELFLETGSREPNKTRFFINTDLLKKFIQSRQAALSKKPNMPEQVQLGALIDSANRLLGTEIGKQYKEPEKDFSNVEIDRVPNPITGNPNDTGNVPLMGKDLRGIGELNAWAKKMQMLVKNTPVAYGQEGFDQCDLLNILYARAVYRGRYQTSPAETAAAQYYQKQIEGFSGPANCRLRGYVAPQTGAGAGGGQVTTATLQQLAGSLPLDLDDIDFNRIRGFFALLRQLSANTGRGSELESIMSEADNRMTQITGMVSRKMGPSGGTQFNLNEDAEAYANMLTPPITQQYVPLLHNLQYVVELTGRVVDAFYAMYARPPSGGEAPRPTFTSEQRSAIEAQTRGGDSYLMRNKERLQSLVQNYSQVVKFK